MSQILQRAADQEGEEFDSFTAHSIRRSAATLFVDAELDLNSIRHQLGWASSSSMPFYYAGIAKKARDKAIRVALSSSAHGVSL